MTLKLYSSLTGKKESFKPKYKNEVKIYGCGPTVYDIPHIGNFRTFTFYDLINRVLKMNGFSTITAVNITDIDDKIINRVNEEKSSLKKITSRYEKSFHEISRNLNIIPNDYNPKATDFVEKMIEFIQRLINEGFAYESNNSVYFIVEKDSNYERFVNLKLINEDVDYAKSNKNQDKRSAGDFALWKSWNENDGDIFWDSPWGKGRPAWHTECAVMIEDLFNGEVDIHCGGIDLKFPHHENECAQIESLSGKKISDYWLHAEHLNIDEEKMSKSLGNFISVNTMIEENGPSAVRLFLLSAHYRTKVSFNLKKLNESKKMIEKITRFANNFDLIDIDNVEFKFSGEHLAFINALNDDLNTAEALGLFFSFISEMNKKINSSSLNESDKEKSLIFLKLFNSIFDIIDFDHSKKQKPPKDVQDLLFSRQEARNNKDWKMSDILRDKLKSMGWYVEDTATGQKLLEKK
ncbi:MAG: cysteine--tRNA ligase [Candidatus Neomarinimicrobiota bacterium]